MASAKRVAEPWGALLTGRQRLHTDAEFIGKDTRLKRRTVWLVSGAVSLGGGFLSSPRGRFGGPSCAGP